MGAVNDMLSKVPLPDVPASLLVAWAIWVIGGLLLMLWFSRRSASTRLPEFRPVSPSHRSGPHAVAGSSSTHAAARKSAVRYTAPTLRDTYGAPTAPPSPRTSGVAPQPSGPVPDAYAELSRLLDSNDDSPQSNS